ncbi:MAG: ABC transporter transmembrane domain-containing protein, partial [Candidatus Hermodarchaeota archaeon]
MRWLFSRLLRHKSLLSFVLFMNFLAIALELLLPLILGEVIDEVILSAQYQLLVILVVVILLIAVLRGISGFIQRYFGGYLGQKIILDLRNELLASFQKQDFTFFDTESTGDLMSRATTDMDALSRFYSFGIRAFAVAAVYYIGIYVFFFITSLEMTLLAL